MYDNEQAQQLTLANTNDFPVITQLWVDDGDINATPENTRAPIMAVPAMLKFSQEEHKSIRLINLNHSEKRDQAGQPHECLKVVFIILCHFSKIFKNRNDT